MNKLLKYSSVIFIVIFLTSCAEKKKMVFNKPEVQIPKKQPQIKHNRGSLYSRKGASLFADKKDLQVGDIIQVVISESLTKDTDNSRDISGNRSTALGGAVAAPNVTGTQAIADKINSKVGLNISTSSSESFSGAVTSEIDESFSTTISVIIQETYQNGNYYIKGSKELLIDEQKQDIIISGVIRPYDITSENSIMSSQIANLKIMYKKDGEEQDILHVPWGTKILKYLWPF